MLLLNLAHFPLRYKATKLYRYIHPNQLYYALEYKIIIKWTEFFFYNNFLLFSRSGNAGGIPQGVAGVTAKQGTLSITFIIIKRNGEKKKKKKKVKF